jgi:FkbH-like protein
MKALASDLRSRLRSTLARMEEYLRPPIDAVEVVKIIKMHYGPDVLDGSSEKEVSADHNGSRGNLFNSLDLSADEITSVLEILESASEGALVDRFLADYAETNRDVWNLWALLNRCRVKQDLNAALRISELMLLKYPELPVSYSSNIQALMDLGQSRRALTIVEKGLKRFPENQWINTFAALLAERRHDYLAAFRGWNKVLEVVPQHEPARQGIFQALLNMDRRKEATDFLSGKPIDIPADIVYGEQYAAPTTLALTASPIQRVLVVGSCLASGLPIAFENTFVGCEADFVLVNNLSPLPDSLPAEVAEYDFQILQIPLRSVMPEAGYLLLNFHDISGYKTFFEACCAKIDASLAEYLKWNVSSGLLAFVTNFFVPQQNAMGRLLERRDLRNPVWFVERLNEYLDEAVSKHKSAYVVNLNAIAAGIGTRYVQDDALWVIAHGAALADTDFELDRARLEVPAPASVYYPLRTLEFVRSFVREIEAMFRTARQIDMVKLVIVDLDDTLWRGVLAESGRTDTEGWPQGLWEALSFLKKRGVLLGIVSKNDEKRVRDLWGENVEHLLPFDTFAVAKINWRAKAENIEEILGEVNLLARSVVFVDDNPVERAAVAAAFPDLRILGRNPYLIRRVLLWAPETQVASISSESSRRTDMVRSQAERERQRKTMSREEFLQSLSVRVRASRVTSCTQAAFPRAFELLNKTNQFNTTGARWSSAKAESFFAAGGVYYVMEVADRFTDYGLAGVMCVNGHRIEQFAMSCRVIGLEVEVAQVAYILDLLFKRGGKQVVAKVIDTDANLVSRDIWKRCGFLLQQDEWIRDLSSRVAVPKHITLSEGDREA